VLEAVPNVSEGRDASVVEDIAGAFASRAILLDVHADVDHHRSVFTLAGEEEPLVDGLLAGIVRAFELIDLRVHDGVHPRVGAVDVVPLVSLTADAMPAARQAAIAVSRRVAAEAGVPVFLYGEVGGGRVPAFFRRGGLEELSRRIASHELIPDAGPATIDPRSGAVLVGARKPLVAYNVVLDTDDVGIAQEIAAVVRESGGGLPGVQALGLFLPRVARVQVSMNVLDIERTPLHVVVECVIAEAAARGVAAVGGELVGLVPERALETARAAGVELPGIDEAHVLERRLGLTW
jgi:glutamate formiminotransferase